MKRVRAAAIGLAVDILFHGHDTLPALLSGGVSMAHAVDDPARAAAMTEAIRNAAAGLVAPG